MIVGFTTMCTYLIGAYHHCCCEFKSHSGRDVKQYVWHKGLLNKLENIGIQGSLLLWIKNYLTDRKQRVVIESAHSKWRTIKAGVPQGSILGPLFFFNIYK